jgi:predicted pyridoxine 5'-phosphate oxidase superfamily flavin-nucleotide-binding protein
MASMYHAAQRALQDRFDTCRLADRLEEVKVHAELTDAEVRFITARDMLFLATCDPAGQPTCSFKAGEPGFIRILDPQTLAFPWYDGNGMYLSAGNVAAWPQVGVLLIDFEAQRRLRLEGDAELADSAEMLAEYPGAQFVVRVRLRRIYPNCPRYIPKYQLAERSAFIPRAGHTAPVPDWKRADWARDVLPAGDPARSEPAAADEREDG